MCPWTVEVEDSPTAKFHEQSVDSHDLQLVCEYNLDGHLFIFATFAILTPPLSLIVLSLS